MYRYSHTANAGCLCVMYQSIDLKQRSKSFAAHRSFTASPRPWSNFDQFRVVYVQL